MNRKLIISALAAATLAIGNAGAGTSTGPFTVRITISNSCTVAVNDLTFPATNDLTPSITGSSTGSVTCTGNSPVTVAIDTGSDGSVQGAVLKMSNGTNIISYNLYTDALYAQIWGDTNGGTFIIPVTPTGGGVATSFNYYGKTVAGQNPVSNGAYIDGVLATVTF